MAKKVLLLSLIILCCPSLGACKQPSERALVNHAIENLHSNDWKQRERGVYSLQDLESRGRRPDKKMQYEAVRLLNNEIDSYKKFADQLRGEGKTVSQILDEQTKQFPLGDYEDYIKALAGYIAFNEMQDGLPVLFRLFVDTDLTVTPALLTRYCDTRIAYFIDKFMSGVSKERTVSVNVLSILVNPPAEIDDFDVRNIPKVSDADLQKIKPVFLKAAGDSDYDTRYAALYGLEAFIADPTVHQTLSKMAKSDEKKTIREEARKILENHGIQ